MIEKASVKLAILASGRQQRKLDNAKEPRTLPFLARIGIDQQAQMLVTKYKMP